MQAHQHQLSFPDQDAINALFYDEILSLPLEYNIIYGNLVDYTMYLPEKSAQMHNCLYAPKIVHFATCAPWDRSLLRHPYHNKWWEIARTVPSTIPTKSSRSFKVRCFIWCIIFIRYLQRRRHQPSLRYLKRRYHKA